MTSRLISPHLLQGREVSARPATFAYGRNRGILGEQLVDLLLRCEE